MGENVKPELSNLSLDDLISAENKAKKQAAKKKRKPQAGLVQPANVEYENFTDEQIRVQLQSRGLSTKGGRPKLVKRLKAEVARAWAQYKKAAKKNDLAGLMPPVVLPKKPKKKLTEEERMAIHEQNEANRLAKAKRRAENLKKQEENQRRKRQKREENQAKQAKLKQQQKIDKEARQRCEVYVQFDLDSYKDALKKKLDPSGNKIINLSEDFSRKGFVVKFKDPSDAAKCTKGSTMKKKKTIKTPLMASIISSPVESKCVFFQYPLDHGHPHMEKAKAWTLTQDSDVNLPELKKLNLWIDSAQKHFATYGTIVNIYRQRGFLVVNFSTENAATKCLQQCESGEFNGIPFHFMRKGTPTKADRQECKKACDAVKAE